MVNDALAGKTVDDLLATAEAVIRDQNRWEYVYPGALQSDACVYRDSRGAPSCLIGHVLYRWGVLDQVRETAAVVALGLLGANDELAFVAQDIQDAQDEGQTWGESLMQGYLTARGKARS